MNYQVFNLPEILQPFVKYFWVLDAGDAVSTLRAFPDKPSGLTYSGKLTAIGISPKLFARISRFQESLYQLRAGKYDKLSDVAYENEYFDQSYFIRVFKEFTGFSPLQFKKNMQSSSS